MSIMDLESRRTTSLLPPERAGRNLTFSADGKSLYFIESGNLLQRYTLSDGTSKKILSRLNGPFAVSPDGENIAFVRHEAPRIDADLMIANSDGREVRKLTTLKAQGYRLWFPSKETIILETVPTGLHEWGHGVLSSITVDTGERRELLSEDQAMRFIWPSSKAGLFELRISGAEYGVALGQIWRRETPKAERHQVTDDRLGFVDLIGVSAVGSIIAVKRPMLSDLSFEGFVGTISSWMHPGWRTQPPRHITGYELVVLHIKP